MISTLAFLAAEPGWPPSLLRLGVVPLLPPELGADLEPVAPSEPGGGEGGDGGGSSSILLRLLA